MKSLRLSFILLFCACFAITSGQDVAAPVFLKSGAQPVQQLTAELTDSCNRTLPRFEGRSYLVLQFSAIPSDQQRKQLTQQGVELLQYLPERAYTATVRMPFSESALRSAGISGLLVLSSAQKMDPLLLSAQLPAWAVKKAGTVNLLVQVSKTYSIADVVSALREGGYQITVLEMQRLHVLGIQAPVGRIRELAGLPFIDYVQPEPPAPQALNFNSRSAARANVLNAPLAKGGRALNGEGIVLGVGDDADVQSHIDFSGRLINHAVVGVSSHGVHVTGTVAGAGNVNELYRGFAPKATIISYFYSGILTNAATHYYDNGMILTCNSYGNIVACDYHGLYDIYAQQLDQQAFDIPELIHVFASGNSGNTTCWPFPARFHTVLGGYQSAKNVITVGATSDSGLIATFSSRGPVKDGRVKPEIVTQGQAVISSVTPNTYASNQGTSMSAPAVTGGMALLIQRYRQLNSNANPKGALMKAILCNGATDRGPSGPDFEYGYGYMNLLRSLDMLESGHYISGNVTQGITNSHSIVVPSNTSQLKVMLYWHDPAASLISSKALVNDLDLELVDLSAGTVLPLRLDTARATLGTAAFSSVDHSNNMEQVVVDNPPAGSYTVRVKGTTIAQNPNQDYFVAWDPIPVSVKLTNPAGGESWAPGDIVKLNWEAYGNPSSTYTLEYSTNNGAGWTTIATGLDAARRIYTWTVPNIPTAQALVRVTQSGTGASSTSSSFVIAAVPVVTLAATANQCDGYIKFSWTAVSGATDYEIMLLRGGEMAPVATTTSTSFTLSGLTRDSLYWLSVRARINGEAGRRSVAVSRQPTNGSCAGSISDGDLMVYAVTAPENGRANTSSALTATTQLRVQVKNLDDVAITGYDLKYRVNGGSWVVEPQAGTINAVSIATINFSTRVNMLAPGSYVIDVVVKNAAGDPNAANDTLTVTLKQLANDPLTLPFSDGFESMTNKTYAFLQVGIDGDDHFDFFSNNAYSRMRTYINSGFAVSGNRAVTLDLSFYNGNSSTNYLIGTFNMANYNAATNDVRLSFRYRNHNQESNSANKVWIRGNDAAAWVEAYDLFANQADAGSVTDVKSIEVSRLLSAAGQNFSSSFQIRWGQYGIYPTADIYGAAGYTFDDIKIFQATDDIQNVAVLEPGTNSCALGNQTPVTIRIRNSSFHAIDSIPVRYQVNGGAWKDGIYLGTIAPGSFDDYTFDSTANLSALASYTIRTLVDYGTDDLHSNDTLTITVVNQPVYSSFPYLQNFESGAGSWYAGGRNSSWQFGTPASPIIDGAASGTHAWKTRLAGNYNDRELSYLYSPCFNVSALSNPTISFALALDLEDCGGTICDAAKLEYSLDGVNWNTLGANGSGTNWYNKAFNVWSIQSYGTWRVATYALPAGASELRLRFAMSSDESTSREGIAIDDIHIYDNVGLFTGSSLPAPILQNVTGSGWINYTSGGTLLASVNANGDSLGTTAVQVFIDTTTARHNLYQFYLGRNFTIKPANRHPADSVSVRLYFSEREFALVQAATSCNTCYKPESAFELGVSKYTDADTSLEDNDLTNNLTGTWKFYTGAGRSIVPFDKGYYIQFKVKDFSEFWFNSGGTNSASLPVRLISFKAKKQDTDARLDWQVGFEQDVQYYDVEVAEGDEALQHGRFEAIGQVAGLGNTSIGRSYHYNDMRAHKSGTYYYRLRIRNLDGSFQFSPIRPVQFTDDYRWFVFPNPSQAVFFLSFRSAEGESIRFSLLDVQGRELRTWSQRASGFVEKASVDLGGSSFPSGMYLLRAEGPGGTQSFRLYKK